MDKNQNLIAEIESLFDFAQNDITNKNKVVRLGLIDDEQAETIEEKTEFNIKGYQRVIDVYGIKHALRQHGNKQTEEKRGQIAITKDDFLLIPQILMSENVIWAGKNRIGKDCLLYEAVIDDVFYYVEEIRSGRKELALNTLYKRKPPKLDGSTATHKT
jgi:hypothetical protein